ncbi:MAG: D-alanyl-D-alanine carboxypeptidase family protein [Gammaproteobacteria bacterium]|nr:D-alanyl-D-alanine carboxypeptidase family protein [Gammaproteobacteria bacterium]
MSFNIKRRAILKAGAATLATGSAGLLLLPVDNKEKLNDVNLINSERIPAVTPALILEHEVAVKDNLQKVKSFNQTFSKDIFLEKNKYVAFHTALNKISKVKKVIGFANFNLISFDDMLNYARRYPQIGSFTKSELVLIDEIFFYDANKYGFHGDKVIKDITSKINKKETVKVAGSGHYLFKGDALTKFNQLEKDVGPNLVLTSGVRSVVKQLQLFLSKLERSKGNLSLTSRSLAPPGHSYHGVGDFDVGKKGYGKLNFTSEFSNTSEYKKLIELKYVDIRYTKDNDVGVRYEPWHIKVV